MPCPVVGMWSRHHAWSLLLCALDVSGSSAFLFFFFFSFKGRLISTTSRKISEHHRSRLL